MRIIRPTAPQHNANQINTPEGERAGRTEPPQQHAQVTVVGRQVIAAPVATRARGWRIRCDA
jgi:hypothetical protein